jgi:hypothetical protein
MANADRDLRITAEGFALTGRLAEALIASRGPKSTS